MKVVCDACTAKYQIPDERVVGRKLKIRCRKCGGAIIIRGDLLQEASAPAPLASASADEWHVSIDGEQHGPYTTDEMTSMLGQDQLDWDVFVWREGLADWEGAAECQPLLAAVSAAGIPLPGDAEPTIAQEAPTAVHDHRGEDVPTAMYSSESFTQGDGLQPVARSSFARRAPSAPGHMPAATGPNPASAFAPSGDAVQASPRVGLGDAMTGERHEDSVLFSLGNLTVASSPVVAPANRGGYASGEGSGLIDIRALASLASASQSSPPIARASMVPPPGNGQSQEDQLLRLANQTGAFSTVDSLAPVDSASRASSPAVPIAIFSGFALIAAAVFGAVYVTRDVPQAPAVVAAAELEAAPPAAEPVAAAELEDAEEPEEVRPPTQEPGDTARPRNELAMLDKPAPARSTAAPVRNKAPTARRPKPGATTKSTANVAKVAEPAPEKEPATLDDVLLGGPSEAEAEKSTPAVATKEEPKAKQPASDRSIDDLLDGAVDKKKIVDSGSAAALPESPSRNDVLEAIRGITAEVKACAAESGASGKAVTAITVQGKNGRVSNVNVTGIQGPAGSCIARAVRKASFPKFSRPTFSVNYPWKF